jgi:hypothetical protein
MALFDWTNQDEHVATKLPLLKEHGPMNSGEKFAEAAGHTVAPGPRRVLMGCVADSKVKYLSQAQRLLQSVRWFGGKLARVDFLVCTVGETDAYYAQEFERLGAIVRTVPPFDHRHPHSNKLRLLELPEIKAYDTVMLLDCDTVIVQDPLPYLDGDAFRAKIADWPTVPHKKLQRLFRSFDLELPRKDYQTNPSGAPTIWYCNAGVLIFPREILSTLGAAWRHFNLALLDRLDLLEPHSFYCDQASLSLAFAAQPVPFQELPLSMNFPTHFERLFSLPEMQACDPIIIHYHDRVNANGQLESIPCPGPQVRIQQFNEQLQGERRRRFDNRIFWDFRYTNDPELGSGLGSRGAVKTYKQRLLHQQMAKWLPASILDVGCGDQSVSEKLPDNIYTGIDISPVVVQRNRTAYPNRQFICADILDSAMPHAEMVICLDVLIHIDDVDRYRAVASRLVALTTGTGLVSGYETAPTHGSSICFYHEPLSETLRRAGARNIKKIGTYRDVIVWAFEPASAQLELGAPKDVVDRSTHGKTPTVISRVRRGIASISKVLTRRGSESDRR